MDVLPILRRVFDPSRFLFDPLRYAALLQDDGQTVQVRIDDRSAVLSFEAMARLESDSGTARARLHSDHPAIAAAFREFEKKHCLAFPVSFERRWPGPAASDAAAIEASLVGMIRKAVENMHMVHTLAPEVLPAFPLDYVETPGRSAPAPAAEPAAPGIAERMGETGPDLAGPDLTGPDRAGPDAPDPVALWRHRLDRFLPPGKPVLGGDDIRRVVRLILTDESLIPHRTPIMRHLDAAIRRITWPEAEWTKDDRGKPLGPPSPGLFLARLTNIRWMNDTAQVHQRLARCGRDSSFATFVRLLAALPDPDTGPGRAAGGAGPGTTPDDQVGSLPGLAAVQAAAILVDWLFVHVNFYPMAGLGHSHDRIDFITNRLLFSEILVPWLERQGPVEEVRRLVGDRTSGSVRILRALRQGFIHESLSVTGGGLARVAAWLGRATPAGLPPKRAPLDLFPEIAPAVLLPLVDGRRRVMESIHLGLARSIADGREYWSEAVLRRNLRELERQVRAAAPVAAVRVPWRALREHAAAAIRSLEAPPADWSALSPRDRSYVSPDELQKPGFVALPVDWRAQVLSRESPPA